MVKPPLERLEPRRQLSSPIGKADQLRFTQLPSIGRWRADGQIILAMLKEMNDISPRDIKNLARALFYSPDEDSQAKIREAVDLLLTEQLAIQVEAD